MKRFLATLAFLVLAVPAFAQTRYYLGPWVWQETSIDSETGLPVPDPRWTPPTGTTSLIDLRTLPQQGSPGPTAQGVGFFAVNGVLTNPYIAVGQGASPSQVTVTNPIRNGWQRATGYSPAGSTLTDILWDQLTNGADPSGMTGPKPLMPKFDEQVNELRLEFRIDTLTRSERFDLATSTVRTKVEAVLQESYREVTQDRNAPTDLPAKTLDYLAEKYGLRKDVKSQWERLVPPDLRNGARLVPHQTTITEDWNCADSDNIDCDLDWTEVVTDIDIVTNAVVGTSTGSDFDTARAESDLSSVDHYVQVTTVETGSSTLFRYGPAARYASAATTFYWAEQDTEESAGRTYAISKVVSGTVTQLSTGVATHGDATYKIEANGSTIKSYKNGAEVESITDTAITTGTRTGIAFFRPNSVISMDNFEAADLAVAATPPRRRMIVIQ